MKKQNWIKNEKDMVVVVAVLAVGLVVGGIALSASLDNARNVVVSDEFRVARYNAGVASKQISDLSNVARVKIEEANSAERSNNMERAEELLNEAQLANTEAARNAAELSRYLEVMKSSVNGMPAGKAQRYAYAAVSSEFSLVSEFFDYTKNVNESIELIAAGIELGKHDKSAIEESLKKANSAVQRINELNTDFQESITKFDIAVQ